MSALADRPQNPVVGTRAAHESAALHVTGAAMYTDDLAGSTMGILTAWPVQSSNAHARVTIDVSAAYAVPGVVRVLTADDVPGVNDAGIKHDEPLFPDEGDVLTGMRSSGCSARRKRPHVSEQPPSPSSTTRSPR